MKSNTAIGAESVLPRGVRRLALRASDEVVTRVEAVTANMFEFAIRQVASLLSVEAEANRLAGPCGRMPLENTPSSSAPSLVTLLAL